ncbi:MAG: response regulator transcription factor [Variovorax sp.]|nr:MAG: response regulator transcription factor [Variovorax sp.]
MPASTSTRLWASMCRRMPGTEQIPVTPAGSSAPAARRPCGRQTTPEPTTRLKIEKDGGTPFMKILVVDDHALFRAGMRLLLNNLSDAATIIEAATLPEAVAALGEHPDMTLCLLDLSLEQANALDALAALKSGAPHVVFVVVSARFDADTIRAALDSGAMSYVPKSMPAATLAEALRRALSGDIFLPEEVRVLVSAPAGKPTLSPRQLDVLHALARGLPSKIIARELAISVSTVKEHIGAMFISLGVRNRTEAVIVASRLGLIATLSK